MEELEQLKTTISILNDSNIELYFKYIEKLNYVTTEILKGKRIQSIDASVISAISLDLNRLFGELQALKQIGNIL